LGSSFFSLPPLPSPSPSTINSSNIFTLPPILPPPPPFILNNNLPPPPPPPILNILPPPPNDISSLNKFSQLPGIPQLP